jgi:predicted nucleotidyltransferase
VVSKPRITTLAGDLGRCLDASARGIRLKAHLMSTDEPNADLTRPLMDAVTLFQRLGIDYALVGGLAAMYYGRARFTEDVDVIAAGDHESVLAIHEDAMRESGFDPGYTWKLYHESGVEIDVWKDAFTDEMVARAREATLAGRHILIVEVHDLIAMKLRAQRPQDDYDVSEILKHTAVDDATVRQRVTDEQYSHYLDIKRRTRQE